MLLLEVVANLIPVLLFAMLGKSTEVGSCMISVCSSLIDPSGDVTVSVFVSTVVVVLLSIGD